MANKMFNVIRFTYTQAIRSKWFIIMLLSGMILIVGVFNFDTIASHLGAEGAPPAVAVYDEAQALPLDEMFSPVSGEALSFKVLQSQTEAAAAIADISGEDSPYTAALYFNSATGETQAYYSASISHETEDILSSLVKETTLLMQAGNLGLGAQQIQALVSGDSITVHNASASPDHQFIVLGLVIFLYVIILLYGTMISNSIVEEKNNRIMETLICASDAKSLLFGKVIGMFAVSLTQIGTWAVLGMIMSKIVPQAGDSLLGGGLVFEGKTIFLLLLFTLLGYLMYAMIFAAMGSLADNSQDATQLMLPITLVLIAVYLVAIFATENPNAGFVVALSYMPFAAPVITFARAVMTDLSWLELAGSIALQVGYIIGIGVVSSRIYKKGVVSYGLLPSLFNRAKRNQKASRAQKSGNISA